MQGKVGVSAMCILGFNVNKGQEISLRLRTDDMKVSARLPSVPMAPRLPSDCAATGMLTSLKVRQ
jgi:hypothetical protein